MFPTARMKMKMDFRFRKINEKTLPKDKIPRGIPASRACVENVCSSSLRKEVQILWPGRQTLSSTRESC